MQALATAAKETIREEKRAVREQIRAEKAAAQALHLIARAMFKATNATLYAVRSQDKIYHVTVCQGRVSSCLDSDSGETCQGRYYSHKCKHGDFALAHESQYGALEAKRQDELATAALVADAVLGSFAQDLPAHLDDEMSTGRAPIAEMDLTQGPTADDPDEVFAELERRRQCSLSGQERRVERTPFDALVLMR